MGIQFPSHIEEQIMSIAKSAMFNILPLSHSPSPFSSSPSSFDYIQQFYIPTVFVQAMQLLQARSVWQE